MRAALKKIGNSSGVIIPKPLLAEMNAAAGDAVELVVEDGRLIIAKAPSDPWEGWEEAAKAIGADGLSEEDREWLDAPLTDDEDWEW